MILKKIYKDDMHHGSFFIDEEDIYCIAETNYYVEVLFKVHQYYREHKMYVL